MRKRQGRQPGGEQTNGQTTHRETEKERGRKRISVRISLTVRKVACRVLALGRQARCNEEVKSWRVHGSMVARVTTWSQTERPILFIIYKLVVR